MSKWTDEEAENAYWAAVKHGTINTPTPVAVGRALLDAREDNAWWKHEHGVLADREAALSLRVAALEAALRMSAYDLHFHQHNHSAAAANAALSGDTSSLRALLLQMAGAVWAEAAPSTQVCSETCIALADRILGGGKP